MKPIFTKQNSKFIPYWNYSVEEMHNEAIQQGKEYLAKSGEEHIATEIAKSQKFRDFRDEP